MKKLITALFCTALALSSGLTAYAAEAPDRESLETAIWEDLWNGKGDNGLEYPEASYKHHLLGKWLDENYGTGGYDWTDVGEVTHGYRRYYRDLIDGWDFEDDNSGNWTIETEDNFYSFTLLNGTWQMIDRNGDTVDTFPPFSTLKNEPEESTGGHQMRNMHREGTMSEEKTVRLESIGMKWDSQIMRNWLDKYRLAKEYYETHGDLNIKVKYIAPDGTKLGTWISTQRNHYLKGVLTDEQIELLEKIGMVWNRDDSRWDTSFRYAEMYTKDGGDINILPEDYCIDSFNLTSWIRNQRDRKKKGKLSADRVQRLESIGLQWEVYEPFWQKNFLLAQEYFIEHGDLLVPQHFETDDGSKLGVWLQNQRTKYRAGKLSDDRIEKLESIGMIWAMEDQRWENGVMHAKTYFEEFGDLAVPQKYVAPDGYNLGTWLGTVRKNYRNGKLSTEKIEQLEALGVVWDPIQQLWLRGYTHAEQYYREHDNLKVVKDYVCTDGYRLGQWLVKQKRDYKSGQMKADRAELLRRIGFEEQAIRAKKCT